MENIGKKVAWIVIASMACIVAGAIFGIIAVANVEGADQTLKTVLMSLVGIVAIVSLISAIISLVGTRKGQVKTAVLASGRNSSIQSLAVIMAFVMAMIGLCNQNPMNQGMLAFVVITFVIAIFTSGLILKSLKGFRKDKENYTYTCTVAFIATGALLLFGVAALIGCLQIPPAGTKHVVGYLSAFALLFVLSDVLSFLSLAVLSKIAIKYAPKTTAADADAEVFNDITKSLNEIKEGQASAKPAQDNVSKLREYKKLLDEGVITQEEFEKKKKELL